MLDDADSAFKKLGMDRAQHGAYLFRSLQENNAILAFGSDWPVRITISHESMNYFTGISGTTVLRSQISILLVVSEQL